MKNLNRNRTTKIKTTFYGVVWYGADYLCSLCNFVITPKFDDQTLLFVDASFFAFVDLNDNMPKPAMVETDTPSNVKK